MPKESWTVAEAVRLAAAVRSQLSLSHRKAQALIDRGAVRVDGQVCTDHGTRLSPGALLEVHTDAPRHPDGDRLSRPLAEILHEDRHLIVLAKPAGVLSIPREDQRALPPPRREPNLEDWLRSRDLRLGERPSVFVVQRLDRGTSGVLLFPRTRFAYDRLKPAFARHEIDRQYLAITVGAPPLDEGTLRHRIIEKHGRVIEAHPTEPGAKDAVTHYRVLDRRSGHARLELTLETGRRNQIRVGCAISGFPILGDTTYGKHSDSIPRVALHARSLGFIHPRSTDPMVFTMAEPDDFVSAWSSVTSDDRESDGM